VDYNEIIYGKNNGIAKITINRPERYNAFTSYTLVEMYYAVRDAWADKSIGVVIITGKGDKAFCTGGDQKTKDDSGYGKGEAEFDLLEAHGQLINIIRAIPKPVIAMVNGFAIGGGNVLQVVCDISIASDNAKFGQAGPKVGSFDAGFGTVYLARLVGERKAREIWYLCRQYSAQEALAMGLVNAVVPQKDLEKEVETWCREILDKAPTSISYIKASFNADTDHISGLNAMSKFAVSLYYGTDECHEGVNAFIEKRKPDFSKFR
jgi:2-ketocyclohexanecarboxyl-CoA hydrolase